MLEAMLTINAIPNYIKNYSQKKFRHFHCLSLKPHNIGYPDKYI